MRALCLPSWSGGRRTARLVGIVRRVAARTAAGLTAAAGPAAGPDAGLAAADEGDDLVRDADRRAADQVPRPEDPDQEADDHQDRDRLHRAPVTRPLHHVDPSDELDDERDREEDEEQR